jgi:hypothetical protein
VCREGCSYGSLAQAKAHGCAWPATHTHAMLRSRHKTQTWSQLQLLEHGAGQPASPRALRVCNVAARSRPECRTHARTHARIQADVASRQHDRRQRRHRGEHVASRVSRGQPPGPAALDPKARPRREVSGDGACIC